MTLNEARRALEALEKALNAYGHAIGCLNCDGETVAPRNSALPPPKAGNPQGRHRNMQTPKMTATMPNKALIIR